MSLCSWIITSHSPCLRCVISQYKWVNLKLGRIKISNHAMNFFFSFEKHLLLPGTNQKKSLYNCILGGLAIYQLFAILPSLCSFFLISRFFFNPNLLFSNFLRFLILFLSYYLKICMLNCSFNLLLHIDIVVY